MPIIVEVKFNENGRAYYFNAEGFLDLVKGDGVLVDSNNSTDFGIVVAKPKEVDISAIRGELKSIIRKATADDWATCKRWKQKEQDAFPLIEKSIQKFNLVMKLTDVKYSFDGSKILISYTSDDRVDFRELVRDLASIFRTRVELRQIGPRDEAKKCGGCGPCGQELCCRRFLNDYQSVTIKMAKSQGLALNPSKINGVCGKLMCCLEYEFPVYRDIQAKMPLLGTRVSTIDGEGEVVYQDLLKEQVVLRFKKDDGFETKSYDLTDLKF